MFIIIQYGNEERLLNPNCKCLFLLEALKRRSQIDDDVEVDVCDEQGNVKLLRDNPDRYAVDLLSDRERLVLIKVDRKESGECDYTPLVDNRTLITDSFLARLSSRTGSATPTTKGQRSGRAREVAQTSGVNSMGQGTATAGNRRTNNVAVAKATSTGSGAAVGGRNSNRTTVTPEPSTSSAASLAAGMTAPTTEVLVGRQKSPNNTGTSNSIQVASVSSTGTAGPKLNANAKKKRERNTSR